jgi:hypothetical protein
MLDLRRGDLDGADPAAVSGLRDRDALVAAGRWLSPLRDAGRSGDRGQ